MCFLLSSNMWVVWVNWIVDVVAIISQINKQESGLRAIVFMKRLNLFPMRMFSVIVFYTKAGHKILYWNCPLGLLISGVIEFIMAVLLRIIYTKYIVYCHGAAKYKKYHLGIRIQI